MKSLPYHNIEFTKQFEKQFNKLKDRHKQKFYARLQIFMLNPHDPILRNHGLKGKYKGYRSIDIDYDLRALYFVRGPRIYIFALIGTHSQLY